MFKKVEESESSYEFFFLVRPLGDERRGVAPGGRRKMIGIQIHLSTVPSYYFCDALFSANAEDVISIQ